MLTVSFPGISIPLKPKDYGHLKNAYRQYLAKPGDRPAQFGLEAAYWRCYKKRASAKLIDDLACLEWGAFKAWSVFGKSSPAVIRYDYTTNAVIEDWGYRRPWSWTVFSTFLLVILYSTSALILCGGLLFAWKLSSLWSTFPIGDLNGSVNDLFLFFILGALTPISLALGLRGLYWCYISTKSATVDSDARKLKRLLDEQQSD